MSKRKCSGDDRSFYEPDTAPQLKIPRRFSVETRAFPAGLGERPVAPPIGAAELRGDVDAILDLCTPDVRWLVARRPVLEGREAGRQLLHAPHLELLALRASDIWLEQSGDLACKTSDTRLGTARPSRRRLGAEPIFGSCAGEDRTGE